MSLSSKDCTILPAPGSWLREGGSAHTSWPRAHYFSPKEAALSPAEQHRACWDPEVQTRCKIIWLRCGGICQRLTPAGWAGLPAVTLPWVTGNKILLLSGLSVSASGCRETQQWRQASWMQTQTRGATSYDCLVISADGLIQMDKNPL